MDKVKVVKVEITYEDGTSNTLTGEDAIKWQEATDSMALVAWNHGHKMPKLDWKNSVKFN